MKKILITLMLLILMVGCTTQKVSHTTFKREYKENRFTKQFQQADSVFNQKNGL
nr:MAG TPA: Prokaryotic membrane lipoprotein lipid attachment site [Caudoviricetes sp.]